MPTAPRDVPEFDDVALVTQIRAGDRSAFLRMYEAAYVPLLRFGYQIAGSRSSAEDAIQNVFVSIWIKRHSWEPRGLIMSYLFKATRNQLLDNLRHARVIERTQSAISIDEPVGMGIQPLAADTKLELLDRAHAVAAAIRRLPERQRTAVIFRWYNNMTTAAIADVMGVSRQAVEKLLRLAEDRLRAVLQTLERR